MLHLIDKAQKLQNNSMIRSGISPLLFFFLGGGDGKGFFFFWVPTNEIWCTWNLFHQSLFEPQLAGVDVWKLDLSP